MPEKTATYKIDFKANVDAIRQIEDRQQRLRMSLGELMKAQREGTVTGAEYEASYRNVNKAIIQSNKELINLKKIMSANTESFQAGMAAIGQFQIASTELARTFGDLDPKAKAVGDSIGALGTGMGDIAASYRTTIEGNKALADAFKGSNFRLKNQASLMDQLKGKNAGQTFKNWAGAAQLVVTTFTTAYKTTRQLIKSVKDLTGVDVDRWATGVAESLMEVGSVSEETRKALEKTYPPGTPARANLLAKASREAGRAIRDVAEAADILQNRSAGISERIDLLKEAGIVFASTLEDEAKTLRSYIKAATDEFGTQEAAMERLGGKVTDFVAKLDNAEGPLGRHAQKLLEVAEKYDLMGESAGAAAQDVEMAASGLDDQAGLSEQAAGATEGAAAAMDQEAEAAEGATESKYALADAEREVATAAEEAGQAFQDSAFTFERFFGTESDLGVGGMLGGFENFMASARPGGGVPMGGMPPEEEMGEMMPMPPEVGGGMDVVAALGPMLDLGNEKVAHKWEQLMEEIRKSREQSSPG